MPDLGQIKPAYARIALLFGLRSAAACLGLILLIQLVGLLVLELFARDAGPLDSGAAVFLTGVRVLVAFLVVALALAAWRWACLAGRRRIAHWVSRHRWQIASLVAVFVVLGVSASALQPQAPPWVSAKRGAGDCEAGGAKDARRMVALQVAGAPKQPASPAAERSLVPCAEAR